LFSKSKGAQGHRGLCGPLSLCGEPGSLGETGKNLCYLFEKQMLLILLLMNLKL
jgi:hypothetical protein